MSDFASKVNESYNKGIHCNPQIEKALTAYGFLKNGLVNKGAKMNEHEKEAREER